MRESEEGAEVGRRSLNASVERQASTESWGVALFAVEAPM